jgi:hypothetical protein
MHKRLFSANLYQISIHACLIVLAILVVVLSRQNANLKTESKEIAAPLRAGDQFVLHNIKGLNDEVLDTTSNRRLILVFTTKCQFCRKSVPTWQSLAKQARASGMSVVGLSLDSVGATVKYASEMGIEFPIFAAVSPERFRKDNKITGVPVTIISGGDSRIQNLWLGLLTQELSAEIQSAIAVPPVKPTKEAI